MEETPSQNEASIEIISEERYSNCLRNNQSTRRRIQLVKQCKFSDESEEDEEVPLKSNSRTNGNNLKLQTFFN